MTERERILKLLYVALVDIRAASHEEGCSTCFALSDVFHNIPLQINQADKAAQSYSDIMAWIEAKCDERQCRSWLKNALAHIEKLP